MGKIVETIVTRFDGGITNAIRDSITSVSGDVLYAKPYSRVIKHFDVLSALGRAIPNLNQTIDTEDASGGGSFALDQMCLFLSWGTAQSNTNQYALGGNNNTTPLIYKRSGATVIPVGAWTAITASANALTGRNENLFIQYGGFVYGARTNAIWRFNIVTPAAITDFQALTFTNISQGLVHSKDDILYIPYDNKIAKYDGSTWTAVALTLPADSYISSICEYGDFLAIAMKPLIIGGRSIVYLWNRDDSLATLTQKIDWGQENLEFIEEIEGELIGISVTGGTSVVVYPKLLFKRWNGGVGIRQFRELRLTNISVLFGKNKQKINNRMYFPLIATVEGTLYAGVWSVGKNAEGEFAVSIDRLLDDSVTFTTSDTILGFQILGDYITIAYKIASTYYVRVTKNSDYTANSTIESLIFTSGRPDLKKDLVGVTVNFEPLPSGSSIAMAYKVDNDSSWTTIFTHSTANSISHSAVNIESTGAALPKDYKEIQFRIISLGSGTQNNGSGVITGYSFKQEITGKRLYD